MTKYERLLQEASDNCVKVCESFDLNGDEDMEHTLDGLYIDGNVALDKRLETTAEKCCVLAEELGHHYTTVGNILDLTDAQNAKQEHRARLCGYNMAIGLRGIISAYECHCIDQHEIAEHLNVTDSYLQEAIECYRSKYGICETVDNYIIYFIPNLMVGKMI